MLKLKTGSGKPEVASGDMFSRRGLKTPNSDHLRTVESVKLFLGKDGIYRILTSTTFNFEGIHAFAER